MTSRIIESLKTGDIKKSELIRLLKARGNLQKKLFEQAKQIRQEYFGNKIFVRGVIEVSNYCRKNCDYCAIRYSNKKLKRYRLTSEEIFFIAKQIKNLGILTLLIQGGEDPNIDKTIKEVLPKIKKKLKIDNVILCLGNRSKEQYKKFKVLGANAYILKFETSNSKLFQEIRYEPLKQRLQCLKWLKKLGFKVGTGNIVGLLGQTIESIADDVLLAKKLNTEFVSIVPFIPNEGSSFEKESHGDFNLALNTLAVLRIMFKNALIPAVSAFEKIKKGGQIMCFDAGANVITVNFTPPQYRKKYLIYCKERFIVTLKHALDCIKTVGLKPDICT